MLDVGAGNGEVLRRIVARYGVRGIGLDPVAQPGSDPRAELRRARIEELTERDFDVVVNIASSHAFGSWFDALAGLAGLARPGGLVLFGEGYWRREPPAAYLEALGGATREDLPLGLDALVRGGEAHGLRSLQLAVASEDDWDRYEWRLIHNGERTASALGESPDAAQLRDVGRPGAAPRPGRGRARHARLRARAVPARLTRGLAAAASSEPGPAGTRTDSRSAVDADGMTSAAMAKTGSGTPPRWAHTWSSARRA